MTENNPQSLSQFMAATSDDLLVMSVNELNMGLALLARRMFEISQERMKLQDAVSRDAALAGESRALEAMKSSWQSVLRTVRDLARG